NSTEDLREAIYASHPKFCRKYNPSTDFKFEHVRTTVGDWLRLYEMHPNPLTLQNLPESWYRVNVWRTIDIAFSDIPFVLFVGGEKAGLASSERKNRDRQLNNVQRMKRKMCGRKGDGYVRTFGPRPVEWAASECGPKWEGENGTKIIRERGLVLPKVLKDILVDLARKFEILHTMEVINGTTSDDDNINRWKNLQNYQRIEIPDCHYTPKKKER
ncbi:33236_t:CDS:2, partial [Gigaspora margarita]